MKLLAISAALLFVSTGATNHGSLSPRVAQTPAYDLASKTADKEAGEGKSAGPVNRRSPLGTRTRDESDRTASKAPHLDRPVDYRALAEKRLRMAHRFELQRNQARAKVRRLQVAIRKLRPQTPAVAHLAGWRCITYGAYPGAPHEGHGWNGPYSGPLQMTNPWLGHSAPNGDWNSIPDLAVYAIAEREAAQHHFSYSFMRGQWPNTYPPCARYF